MSETIPALKELREFLIDHNAADAVHRALDVITHHLSMLPEERAQRDFVTDDWVRIRYPEGASLVGKIRAFIMGGVRLSGFTGTFQVHQFEHWYPENQDEVWHIAYKKMATLCEPMRRGSDEVAVLDLRNDRQWWTLSDIEPYVGQSDK